MEYKDLFLALIVVALASTAYVGIANDLNSSWNTQIESGLETEVEQIRLGVAGNLSQTAQQSQEKGSAELGSSQGTGEDNVYQQALRIIRTIPTLAGLPGKLIQIAGSALGVPPWITQLFFWLFNFVFWITLAYLLITGVRSLIS